MLDLFVRHGLLLGVTADLIKTYSQRWKVSDFQALLETNIFDENQLADHLASLNKLDRLFSLTPYEDGSELRDLVTFEEARSKNFFILGCQPDSQLVDVAIVDPSDKALLESIQQKLLPYQVRFGVGSFTEILRSIDHAYSVEAQIPSLFH